MFEYVLGLVYLVVDISAGNTVGYFPLGRYFWRSRGRDNFIEKLKTQAEKLDILNQIFEGNSDWFEATTAHAQERIQNISLF